MSLLKICNACNERPAGCWKAVEYGCQQRFRDAETLAAETAGCPIGLLGGIHLPSLLTVVYTADKPHCRDRWPRVTAMLDGFGFTNWRWHVGQPGFPYWQAIRPDFARILRENKPPILFLEDDIAVRDFRPWLHIPPCDVAYLGGGGCWPGGSLVRESRRRLPELHIYQVREIGWSDIEGEKHWVRVFGMFGTHAMIFFDKRTMLEMADAIDSHDCPVDVCFGHNQWRWNCILRKVPVWYQDDGHNNNGTFDYSPRPFFTSPISRIDAARHEISKRRQLVLH